MRIFQLQYERSYCFVAGTMFQEYSLLMFGPVNVISQNHDLCLFAVGYGVVYGHMVEQTIQIQKQQLANILQRINRIKS